MLFFPWRNVRFAVVLVEVVIAATTFLYYRSGHRAPSEDQFSLEVDSETPQEPPHPQSQWTIGEVQRPPPYQIDDAGAPWETSKYVNGPPTDNFRDNLRSDVLYVTSWNDAGFTNQFMAYVNLIYLGILSERVPIVPPFAPFHHITQDAGILPFGWIFDLPHLRDTLRLPVLEWLDVQTMTPTSDSLQPEPLGCWTAWYTSNPGGNSPRRSPALTNWLNLDVSFQPVPENTRRFTLTERPWDWMLLFTPLSALIFTPTIPEYKDAGKGKALFPSASGVDLPPDEHLSCFDLLYFVWSGKGDDEWAQPWSPAWRTVGQHLRFTEEINDMVKGYLRRTFELPAYDTDLPPFIAIHVRHGDFLESGPCESLKTAEECFAPISSYARRVREVQEELFEKYGVNIPDKHVLLTSDEKDEDWWAEVSARGWKTIDHARERTLETHGEWYLTITDVVAHSLALGFVGTDQSTVSVISQKRVEEWNNGISRSVRFGVNQVHDHFKFD